MSQLQTFETYLEDLEQFLLFKDCVLQINGDAFLSRVVRSIVVEIAVAIREPVAVVEPVLHHLHAVALRTRELTLHEKLRVFAGLRTQLHLSVVKRLK